jgi:hypothetical protein
MKDYGDVHGVYTLSCSNTLYDEQRLRENVDFDV